MSTGINSANGLSISRRITIDQIINSNQHDQPDNLPYERRKPKPGIGLLSTTLFKSSMTKWILSARIRSRDLHELLFIGENEVRIKEILPNGDLRRLTTIKNFPSQIRAAAVIGEELELTATMKMEDSQDDYNSKKGALRGLPPQVLVLALESSELRFLIFDAACPTGVHFWQTSFPLPTFRTLLKTPGRTISVDPLGRALVVSASSNTILVFSLKSRATLEVEYATKPNLWNPIFQERQLYVDGSILAIDFLHPGPGNEDHIVLVIVAIVGGASRLSCYEWEQARGLQAIRPVVKSIRLPKSETDSSASFEFRSPTETAPEHCNLMIPMANFPSFLLVHGSHVRICRNILSGSPDVSDVPAKAWEQDPRHWASSSRRPAYTAWTRCARLASWKNRGNESLYLIREDGVIRNYTRGNDLGTGSLGNAGQFDCTVSTAVSSFLLHLTHPDCLVAAGDMCNGQVVAFGDLGASSSREEAMAMKVRRTFPNWAPIMDLQVVPSAGNAGNAGDEVSNRSNIFATSGRQPYGAISELRKGLEARILIEADLGHSDGLTGSYGLWSFPDPFERGIHFFLTYPGATTAWLLNAEEEMEPSELNLDLESDTLLATITSNNIVIQVTERALFVSLVIDESPPSPLVVPDIPHGSRIVAADFERDNSALLLTLRSGNRTYLDLFVVPTAMSPGTVIRVSAPLALNADLTCLSLFKHQGALFAVTALRDGMLHLFLVDLSFGLSTVSKIPIGQSGSTQMSPVAQSVLAMSMYAESTPEPSQLIVCGLRNGDLFTVEIQFSNQGVQIITSWENPKTIKLGTGPINLSRNKPSSVFALCGLDTCRLDCTPSTKGLLVSSIFLTDPINPDLDRPKLSALHTLGHPDSETTQIACIDGSTLRIASLEESLHVIPRRIPLNKKIPSLAPLGALTGPSGTPQKLLYSARLEALVIGSVKFEHKAHSTTYPGPSAPYLGMRTIRGALQFMPLDNEEIPPGIGEVQPTDKSTLIELLPGEKLMTMVEYKFRRDTDKPGYYHFLLAGTKQTHEDESQTGRLLFLRPSRLQNGTIKVDLPIARIYDFPVRAIAICESKIVLSGNKNIAVFELANVKDRGLRLNALCSINLTSHAIHLTTSSPFIRATTAADSIQTFKLSSTPSVNNPGQISYNLKLFSSDSIARETLIHLPVQIPQPSEPPPRASSSPISQLLNITPTKRNIILASDRSGTVFALSHPEFQIYQTAAPTLFELTLPQCVTRFVQSPSIRPPWRRITDPGVIEADILGSCTDGTIYQFSIVDNKTRLLLKFLENLVKWNREEEMRNAQGARWFGGERVVVDPEWEVGEQKMKSGYAVNGDLLDAFLGEDGATVLKGMLVREEVSGEEEYEGIRRWNGNEVGSRCEKFGKLLGQVVDMDVVGVGVGLEERVERCVEWLGGVMVEML